MNPRTLSDDLKPADSVALFDSATALLAALGAALAGPGVPASRQSGVYRPGWSAPAGHLPWPLLRQIYTRVGAAEGVDPARLGDVDLAAVARWLTEQYPRRRYPAVFVGSSNGALAHLAAAIGAPWLPGTVLVPVARVGDPDRPVDALRFGERHAPALLERNPDVVLHHMHDQAQDELMVARMTYFRTKWQRLPAAYADFLDPSLLPDAPVIIVDDRSSWPVVRVGERHVFQPGAQGGLHPAGLPGRPHTPTTDDEAPEAEWGAEPGFTAAVTDWARTNGRRVVTITLPGPQEAAHPVATVFRDWYREPRPGRRPAAGADLHRRRPVADHDHRLGAVLGLLLRPVGAGRPRGPPGPQRPVRRGPAAALPARRRLPRHRHAGRLDRPSSRSTAPAPTSSAWTPTSSRTTSASSAATPRLWPDCPTLAASGPRWTSRSR